MDGKADIGLADGPRETDARTFHQTEAVYVARRNVSQTQKGHRIEVVVGERSSAAIAVAIPLAALNMEKETRVVLPERKFHG